MREFWSCVTLSAHSASPSAHSHTHQPHIYKVCGPPAQLSANQNAAIDREASVRELAGVSRLGIVKKKRNK